MNEKFCCYYISILAGVQVILPSDRQTKIKNFTNYMKLYIFSRLTLPQVKKFLTLPSSSFVSLLLVGKQTDTQACKMFRFPSHLWLMKVCIICRFCSNRRACSRFIRYCRQASQSQRRICCIKVCFCTQTNERAKCQWNLNTTLQTFSRSRPELQVRKCNSRLAWPKEGNIKGCSAVHIRKAAAAKAS